MTTGRINQVTISVQWSLAFAKLTPTASGRVNFLVKQSKAQESGSFNSASTRHTFSHNGSQSSFPQVLSRINLAGAKYQGHRED